MENISRRLKAVREQAGLNQKQVGDFLGVTQSLISKVEKGERSLDINQLEKLLALYGYSLAEFESENRQVEPIRFAFRAQDASNCDLNALEDINRIVINLREMYSLLEQK